LGGGGGGFLLAGGQGVIGTKVHMLDRDHDGVQTGELNQLGPVVLSISILH